MVQFSADEITRFTSNNHVRYNSGVPTGNNNFGALRGVLIIPKNRFFEVSIHVLNENFSNWGELQMEPKQMRVVDIEKTTFETVISMRGYGYDMFGSPFSDYGIKIFLDYNNVINKITLIMYDRDVEIEYLAD